MFFEQALNHHATPCESHGESHDETHDETI
jgi:hypothetical protein